jgi:DinB superfamily
MTYGVRSVHLQSTMNDETKELLQTLARTPAEISDLLSHIPPENIQLRPSPEEFSILESICHLRDIEVDGYTVRIRRLLAEDDPQLDDIDGARLAVERDYNRQRIEPALETFATERTKNVELLRTINEEDLERKASMQGIGEITLRTLIEMMIEHDEGHLDELRRAGRLLRSQESEI